jgi:hypothetical protein
MICGQQYTDCDSVTFAVQPHEHSRSSLNKEITMRYALIAGLVLALSVAAFGGGNPCVRAYIDFDPPNKVHEIVPTAYTTIRAYVCFDCLDLGLTVVVFMLSDPSVDYPGVVSPPSFTSLLPGGLFIGDAFDGGIQVASTECVGDGGYVCAGYAEMFYLGGACCLNILDHPGGTPGNPWARWVVDCAQPFGEVDLYCVLSNGSIGDPAPTLCPPGDVPCECPCTVPTNTTSWGRMKTLYR